MVFLQLVRGFSEELSPSGLTHEGQCCVAERDEIGDVNVEAAGEFAFNNALQLFPFGAFGPLCQEEYL